MQTTLAVEKQAQSTSSSEADDYSIVFQYFLFCPLSSGSCTVIYVISL